MNPRELQSHAELFEFLVQLGTNLQNCGQLELAEIVTHASRFASGSPSEFLHEAQLALDRVEAIQPPTLSQRELQSVAVVLVQIRESFRKVGGA